MPFFTSKLNCSQQSTSWELNRSTFWNNETCVQKSSLYINFIVYLVFRYHFPYTNCNMSGFVEQILQFVHKGIPYSFKAKGLFWNIYKPNENCWGQPTLLCVPGQLPLLIFIYITFAKKSLKSQHGRISKSYNNIENYPWMGYISFTTSLHVLNSSMTHCPNKYNACGVSFLT